MDAERFQAVCDYVEFDTHSSGILLNLLPVVQPHFTGLVDDFYLAVASDPATSGVLSGAEDQVVRLKATLLTWLHSVFSDARDERFLESRRRIGRAHVHINLTQEYMFASINRLRSGLVEIALSALSHQESADSIKAINQALDLELALMLDTYREDWLVRVDASARLAAIGQVAASIGHELRNPLSVMESSIYLMTQHQRVNSQTDPIIDKHLKRIHSQIRHCANTVSSLLDMARDAPLQRSKFALSDFVNACVAQVYYPPELVVSVGVDAGLVIYADPEQLARVVINLLRNAVEALGASGIVEIGAQAAPNGIELWVEDNGPGIPPAHRANIFDVLFTTRAKGTGLGLALCRRIIDRHGGEVTLDPSPLHGTRFRIRLPDEASAPPV